MILFELAYYIIGFNKDDERIPQLSSGFVTADKKQVALPVGEKLFWVVINFPNFPPPQANKLSFVGIGRPKCEWNSDSEC